MLPPYKLNGWFDVDYINLQLRQAIETLNIKLVEKGKEILDYKEKNNIQFQVPEKILEEDESAADNSEPSKPPTIDSAGKGVLLSEKLSST